jgi:Kef-type K+ transport system membrane component KefB/nucleotide-binding universal stress UspA family protein
MTPRLSPTQITLLFLHLALLLAAARVLGELMKRLRQPAVIGELLAGVLLGPSLLGWAAPGVFRALFPPDVPWMPVLEVVSWFGLALLMLFTGLETDVRLLRSLGRPAFMASAFGLLIPFGAGLALGGILPDRLVPAGSTRLLTSLFLATALSVSAMPVIAKILMDLNLLKRNVGVVTLTAAVVDDTVGWIALALIAGMAGAGTFQVDRLLLTLGLLAAFLVAARVVLFPAVRWLLRRTAGAGAPPGRQTVILVVFAFLCAAATEAIGVHAVFGAFVAGTILRQCPAVVPDTLHRIEGIVMSVFAPVFFGAVGLRVDFTQVQGFAWPLILLGFAVGGKVIGCTLGGLLGRMSLPESLVIGFGMNARGAMGLVVALIGISLGVIGQELFSSIVLMAIVTSLMAPLLVRPLVRRLPVTAEERERAAAAPAGFLPKGRLRALIPTGGGDNAVLGCHLAAVVGGDEGDVVTALYVETSRPPWWTALAFWRPRPRLDLEALIGDIRGASQGSLNLRKVTPAGSVLDTLLEEARKGYDVLFLGASEKSHPVYDPFVSAIVRAQPCHIVIVRRPREGGSSTPFRRILVPVNGSYPSDAAVQLAADYAARTQAKIDVLYVIESQQRNPLLPAAGADPAAEDAQERMRRSLHEQYAGRTPAAALEVKVRVAASVGAAVAEEAAGGADLVILGAENKSIVERVYLGQNIEALLEALPCTVALVLPRIAGR